MRRIIAAFLVLLLVVQLIPACAAGKGMSISACHKVSLSYSDTTRENGSVVRLWQVDTAREDVTGEINGIARGFSDELAADLPEAVNSSSQNSRLDIGIRTSRTGTSWMSFVIQARTTYHRDLVDQRIETRTYDMETGRQILLTDIFPSDSIAWFVLCDAVNDQVSAYWPEEVADDELLRQLSSRASLEKMPFSLQGMSLVLYIPAQEVYPEHHSLMKVTLYYPQIRGMMTAEAAAQTDNDSLYSLVSLTFDDGPVRTNTTRVLNELMKYSAVATFFVVGNRVEPFADLVQREYDEGHGVGSHNWTHGNVNKLTGPRMQQIPGLVNASMVKTIGLPVKYDRVPYGLYNRMIAAKVGMSYIQWSVDTYDWRGGAVSGIVSKVRNQLQDGDIILCHDVKNNTADAVGEMVTWMENNGFMLLTIDELFAKDNVELQPDKVYFRNQNGVTTIKKR